MVVEILMEDGVVQPKYESELASGMDVRAFVKNWQQVYQVNVDSRGVYGDENGFFIPPHARVIVPTGIKVAIEPGYEMQVRSRSGLSLKKGLIVVQGVGTIDADYRGEVGICLANISQSEVYVEFGERIAQLVFQKVEKVDFEVVKKLSKTDRGSGGFGSTGK